MRTLHSGMRKKTMPSFQTNTNKRHALFPHGARIALQRLVDETDYSEPTQMPRTLPRSLQIPGGKIACTSHPSTRFRSSSPSCFGRTFNIWKNVEIQKSGSSENFGGTWNLQSNIQNLEKRSNSNKRVIRTFRCSTSNIRSNVRICGRTFKIHKK